MNVSAKTLFVILLFVSTFGQVTSDIYLPSLPAIAQSLQTNSGPIQLSLALYMLGFGSSQLFYGPYSDYAGRRAPILIGTFIAIIGSLFCLFASSAAWLIFGRFLQGLGAGAGTAIGRSILRDCFSGTALAKFGSLLVLGNTVLMASAPTLGGYFQHYLGWRATFAFLLIYSVFIFLLVWFRLPQTNKFLNKSALKPIIIWQNIKTLLTSRVFLGFALCTSFSYAAVLAYLTASPFLLQELAGLTPVEYGWLGFLIAACYMSGGFLNVKFVEQFGIAKLMIFGSLLMISAGLLMFFMGYHHIVTALSILLPIAIFLFGSGFVFANAFAGAFTPFPHIAGLAGSVFGSIQILGGAVASAIVAKLHDKSQIPLSIILMAFAGLVFVFTLIAVGDYKKS